ncbi:hypothetical protein [Malikia spinosa]|uniref:Mobilization protein n=1 Tax=Malikia spinosa TaxID=86180 RepID=A0A7C9J8J6_9BURK|nr:hypothetical protein [Malikia spinosa]MYZ52470.1 hypothetical protein [Malikia spinosa]
MEAEVGSVKTARKARTLDEEIAHQREKLRKLEERQREQQRREREKNQKAVLELIKAERLDTVPAERWRAAMPKLKALLAVEPEPGKMPQAGTP